MNSLVLFVGLLVVALSNGLSVNRGSRDVSHAGVPGGPVPVAPVVPVVNNGSPDNEPSTTTEGPSTEETSTTDGVSTTVETSTTEGPSKGTSTEKSFTEDTFTDVMNTVDSTDESFPKFEVDTPGYLYLDGNNGLVIVTFLGEYQNYTISENVSTEEFTLGENNYYISILDLEQSQYVIGINFVIVSKESSYGDNLDDIVNTWREWFVEWIWKTGRRKRSTDSEWDSDAEKELKELFDKGVFKKAPKEKQKAGFPSEAPSIIP